LPFSGAMQQIASPQTVTMSPWSNTTRQILALEDRGNLPAAAKLAEKLVIDLTKYEPSQGTKRRGRSPSATINRVPGVRGSGGVRGRSVVPLL
jgi:hypothetical protein